MRRIVALGIFLLFVASGTSQAETVIYADRSLFEAELDTLVIDDYENPGYPGGNTGPVISAVVGETDYISLVVPNVHFILSGGASDTNSQYYCHGCDVPFILSFGTTSVGTAQGVFGAGFDIVFHFEGGQGKLYSAFVEFSDGAQAQYSLPRVEEADIDLFWGITSTLLVNNISFCFEASCANSDTRFAMDHLTIGNTLPFTEPPAIPIPATLPLLGFALLGLSVVGRSGRWWIKGAENSN